MQHSYVNALDNEDKMGARSHTKTHDQGGPPVGQPSTSSRQSAGRSLTSDLALHVRLTNDLKRRLEDGEWSARDQLPTEEALAHDYAVSRATVRLSLKLLEAQGLVHTRRGAGTFVTALGAQVGWGLQELRSTSETVRAQGFVPSVLCHRAELRTCTSEFAERMSLPFSTKVVYLEREILADGQLISYAYEEVRADLIKVPIVPLHFSSSLFTLLEQTAGIRHGYAAAKINAVYDAKVGWGDTRPQSPLYLRLYQTHFTQDGTPTLFSKNYFVEGEFQFSLMRVAS